ncbi:MAG: translation elongation factor 4 [Anaeromassilibacillus sp.]|uniref:translation elongation factor 4 n=1 Tax=Anaeromassilibacillus sp. An172 TaxID=1965570 RepID=UPI000B38E618|nr:translation elongation factor 4 [Anaeromassilibacillus sp. An172]MCI6497198.1 translation elongation factor 4 [Anaeromassilibacillus sp.]MDY3779183.1 translation elongation factor 4 [Candidatus Limousia pullorum]MEE0762664.1 translation elongation factor 4 [Acutalibacteraceae bacterium]OUP77152.1 elongation factor 4 [Anaeromassilibacillus sp. An172]
MGFQQDRIRNFSIIAHIDHGKSTLADRILEQTKSVSLREMEDQILDDMELERERGITIKAHAVTLVYNADDGNDYLFNLIDTPGHVDFNYEVSRSLAACEGAVLVVDASQGIEAQTLANTYLAVDSGLEIVPVVNKIDLPSADPDKVIKEIEDVIGIPAEDAPRISAKAGINIHDVMEKIVSDVPAPTGDINAPLRALIFDSYYDSYKGVIIYVRIKEGQIHPGDEFKLMATGSVFNVVECGFMRATTLDPTDGLYAGEVGYIAASIKSLQDAKVGDTVTLTSNPAPEPLPGYREAQSMVFCGIYPADGAKYGDLRDALDKLKLNDASLTFEPETSVALGFGFRCGFLGLLHMEIIQERLEREYNLDLITTAPSVIYRITKTDGTVEMIDNPTNYPDPSLVMKAEEPMTNAHIYSPTEYVGNIMELCQDRRGIFKDMTYIDSDRVDIHYELPLAEIIYDFFDTLKSRTRGYASFDYELKDYMESKLVKLDIMLNGEVVDALSFIIHADKAYSRARKMAEKLKEKIPRQLFEIPIQACIGGKIIARETVKALRKDVLAKCYGGDITRKKKLLEKQKEGKKRMRQLGTVEVPQDAFMAVLKLDTD